jgi:hypothetical protein
VLPLPQALVTAYEGLLWGAYRYRVSWLLGRGLLERTIRKYRLGHSGLAFTIPLWGPHGELQGIKLRHDEVLYPENPPEKKYWGIRGHSKVQLYGLWRQNLQGRDVVLTEGELDCLRLLQEKRSFAVVTSTGGAQSWKAELAVELQGAKRVYLAFDQDSAGEAGAQNCAQVLRAHELPTRVVRWDAGSGKDITELLLRRGMDAFYDALRRAGP